MKDNKDALLIGGEEVTFNLMAVTISEWRKFAKSGYLDEEDDEILARVTGRPLEWIRGLPQPEHRKLSDAYVTRSMRPLDNPN